MSSTDPTKVFSSFENDVIVYTSLSLGGLSIIACLVVIGEYFSHRRYSSIPSSSVMPLCLMGSDLMLAASSMMESMQHDGVTNNGMCKFVGILSQYSSLCSFLWTAAISAKTYSLVSHLFISDLSPRGQRMHVARSNSITGTSNKFETNSEIIYHLICWGIPFLSIIIMLATSSAGYKSNSCWLKLSPQSKMPLVVAVLFYWLPLIGLELYNIRVFRFLIQTVSKMPQSQHLFRRFTR